MYQETHLVNLKRNRLFLPDSLVGIAISNSIVDTKIYQRYLNAFSEQYNLTDCPFIICLGSKSERKPESSKFLDKLFLFGNSITLTDKILNFLNLSDKITLIDCREHFELWNPEFQKRFFSTTV